MEFRRMIYHNLIQFLTFLFSNWWNVGEKKFFSKYLFRVVGRSENHEGKKYCGSRNLPPWYEWFFRKVITILTPTKLLLEPTHPQISRPSYGLVLACISNSFFTEFMVGYYSSLKSQKVRQFVRTLNIY